MPNTANTRRDPQKGEKGLPKYKGATAKGFTVVELMIVIAVLAVLMSLALPSYRTLIEKRQVTSGAEQVAAFLSAAQLEAVRRNEPIAVAYWHNDDLDAPVWCFGMVVGETACDVNGCSGISDSCLIDGTPRVFDASNLNHDDALVAMTGDGAFVIDPVRGMMSDFTDSMTVQFLSKPERTYALNLEMNPTGRTRICSDTTRADNSVPGFEPCQ